MQEFTVPDPLTSRRAGDEPTPSADQATGAGYDDDFALWLDRQVAALRARRLDAIDLGHLIEELESMSKRDRRELASRLETLLMHLLKCEFQPEMKSGHWLSTLLEQRTRIDDLLADSPSLGDRIEPLIAERFTDAAARAALETGLARDAFPSACTYTVEQMLDRSFVP